MTQRLAMAFRASSIADLLLSFRSCPACTSRTARCFMLVVLTCHHAAAALRVLTRITYGAAGAAGYPSVHRNAQT